MTCHPASQPEQCRPCVGVSDSTRRRQDRRYAGSHKPRNDGESRHQREAKFGGLQRSCSARDFVAIHFKGTDIAAHDRRPLEKRDFISAIDTALGRFLWKNPMVTDGLRVVVSADHGTSCLTGNRTADPVPLSGQLVG